MVKLSDDISVLSGIGPKKKEQLASVGIFTVSDALFHAPLRYEDRRERKDIAALRDGEKAGVLAIFTGKMQVTRKNGKTLYTGTFRDGTGSLSVTFQNSPYVARAFISGRAYALYGRVAKKGSMCRMFSPVFVPRGAKTDKIGRIVPIYPCGGEASRSLLQSVISACVSSLSEPVPDFLPPEIVEKAGIYEKNRAIAALHNPSDMQDAEKALERLKFEELFLLFTGMRMQRAALAGKKGSILSANMEPFYKNLPFSPTKGQTDAISDILRDMGSGKVMNRLLEGDVGSGKTVVAAAALYIAAMSGRSGVLMAPTEILARQHAETLKKLLPDFPVCLLTGRLKSAERRKAEEDIKEGRAQIIVATQAVLSEKLNLQNVAVVIVDEQHRFGVRQRGFLSSLPQSPHVLVMSATPIPRTLSLTFYGDLDISVLPAVPKGRQAVDTFAVPPSYRERIYTFIEKELQKGNRAYIICPLALEGEEEDALPDAESYAKMLSSRFSEETVLCLHGKMKNKEAVMEAFSKGAPKILVSTTVVEVGVDVPSATVIVVENAERFGLSQLHQLRGRVGRGTEKSYCILISEPHTKEAKERLATMKNERDGFKIAEADLRLRGAGEFFGTRQHGDMQLLYADILEDSRLLPLAASSAEAVLKGDNTLKKYPEIKKAVKTLYDRFAMN